VTALENHLQQANAQADVPVEDGLSPISIFATELQSAFVAMVIVLPALDLFLSFITKRDATFPISHKNPHLHALSSILGRNTVWMQILTL
jgi:hypothetical protein